MSHRLDEGAPLLDELARAARVAGAGWVRALGTVRDVVLAVDGPTGLTPVLTWDGEATLVSLDASWDGDALQATATVSLLAGGVPVVSAGRLVRAEVMDVLCATIGGGAGSVASASAAPGARPSAPPSRPDTSFAAPRPASAPQRSEAASPPRSSAVERPGTAPQAARPATSAGGASAGSAAPARPAGPSAWAAVAKSSEQLKLREWAAQTDDDEDEVDPEDLKRGDVLMHPTLGECVFQSRLDVNSAHVRVPGGRVRKLMLNIFRITQEGSSRRFTLASRRQ